MPDQTKCPSCGAPIFWCETAAGNRMPVDAVARADGNIVLVEGKAHTLRRDLWEEQHDGPRYQSHFVSCPNAKQHRRKK